MEANLSTLERVYILASSHVCVDVGVGVCLCVHDRLLALKREFV